MSIPVVLMRAKPCAKPCFPPAFLLLSKNDFGRSVVSWLQEGPALWGTVPGVLGLRAPSSLAGLAELRGQCKLAGGRVDPGAWKSILRQL